MAEIVSFGKTEAELEEYNDRAIQYKIDAGLLTEEDVSLIREFVNAQRVQNGAGPARSYKLLNILTNIAARYIKTPLKDNKISDINAAVLRIKSGSRIITKVVKTRPAETEGMTVREISVNGETRYHVTKEGKPLSQDTKKDFIIFLKRFYLWMVEEGYSDVSAEKLRKIRAPPAKRSGKTAEMMLSEGEVIQMINACTGSSRVRDRALISLLYEAGLRIHEAAKLCWSDVKFDGPFLKLNVQGKTQYPRYIPLTTSKCYLAEWRSIYPDGEPSGNKPIFITSHLEGQDVTYKTFTYPYAAKLLRLRAKQAGIEKPITPHLFRHSRITELLRQGFSETIIKSMMWGSISSQMLSHYSHLVNEDTDKAVARAAGIDIEDEAEKEQEAFKNHICGRCHTICPPTAKYCSVCGAPLTEEVRLELSEAQAEIHADQRYISMLEKLQKQVNDLTAIISGQS